MRLDEEGAFLLGIDVMVFVCIPSYLPVTYLPVWRGSCVWLWWNCCQVRRRWLVAAGHRNNLTVVRWILTSWCRRISMALTLRCVTVMKTSATVSCLSSNCSSMFYSSPTFVYNHDKLTAYFNYFCFLSKFFQWVAVIITSTFYRSPTVHTRPCSKQFGV